MGMVFERVARNFLGGTAGQIRNDLLANGKWTRNTLSRQINHLAAQQPLVVPGKNLAGRTIRNTGSALRLWTTRVPVGDLYNQLVIDVQLLPTDTTAGSPRWWIEKDGVSQGDQFHNVRCASGAGTQFSDIFEMQQVISVTPNANHKIDLWTDDNCRVAGWDLHIKPRDTLDTAADTYSDYTYVLPLSPARDDWLARANSVFETAWWANRGAHLSWNVDDPASPVVVNSLVAADLWSAASVGPTAPTQYRNSYSNKNLLGGLANESIKTVCWALGERTAGIGNVIARFIGDNHAGGVDVNITGALGIYTSTAFTLKPQAAGDCIRVKYLMDSGGTVGNIYAVGLYPLNI